MRSPIYLDYNATTPVAPTVIDVLHASMKDVFGNASSSHEHGSRARSTLEKARQQVALLLDTDPDCICFTSGGTESDNIALLGAAKKTPRERRHIVTSNVEHPAVEETCAYLETQGYAVTRVPVLDDGRVKAEDVIDAMREDTFLVTVMLANNETGAIQPIEAIGEECQKRHVLCHTDAAQAVGKIPTLVSRLSVDLLTLAGHKLYAPKGIGALYVRTGVDLAPIQFGGGHERGLRPGTENIPLIAALGEACRLALEEMEDRMAHSTDLRDRLRMRLVEDLGPIDLNGPEKARLPNTLNVSIPGVFAQEILSRIKGVSTSAGSACHAGHSKPSKVLLAMGISEAQALSALRLSVGRDTTIEDVDRAVAEISTVAKFLRVQS